MGPDPGRAFRFAAVGAVAASLAVVLLAASLVPLGAAGHLRGAISHGCAELAHVAGNVVALALTAFVVVTALAALLAVTGSVRASIGLRRAWVECADERSRRARRIARRVGVTARVRVLESSRAFACSRGWFAPGIAISAGAVDRLRDVELAAVLMHEQAHCDRRDPARYVLLRVAAAALFALPVVDAARMRFERAAELFADDRARETAGATATASALLAFVHPPIPGLAVQFGSVTVGERVARLLGDPMPEQPRSRSVRTSTTVVLLVVLGVGALWALPSMG